MPAARSSLTPALGVNAIRLVGASLLQQINKKGGENMKLMTKELEQRFAQVGSQENVNDPIIIAKVFNPAGAGTWYATEFDPDERTFFGYVSIISDWNDEWGYFSLDELESFQGQFKIGVERDLYFGEKPASQVIKK